MSDSHDIEKFMECLARGPKGGQELTFDPRSGRLEVVKSPNRGKELMFDPSTGRLDVLKPGKCNPDQKVVADMAQQGFFDPC